MNLLEDKIDTGLMLCSFVFFCLSYFFPGHEFHLLIVSFFFAALKLYRDYKLK
ncbi:hypothetical protein SHI21_03305 [Bacteriovorax sp. PP10]|uniref:Uncharacterized protein n=1 Tax=Bacteriovorax antarcticus TaxID=3088717 RepID=A0ABU5VS39_9BACT|nr:hypothetical protein [Bacteriovorax sp. PP10]MEA9355208.1 hypothetical protein [Bacteriovorax sp. PP10]